MSILNFQEDSFVTYSLMTKFLFKKNQISKAYISRTKTI